MENKMLQPLAVAIKEEILHESENEEVGNPLKDSKEGLDLNASEFVETERIAPDFYKKMKLSRVSRKFEKTREVDEVHKKLQEKKYILMPKTGARSEAWKRFHTIVDVATGKKTNFVQCIFCNFTRQYTGTTAGTSQLLRHTCENSKEVPYANASKQCAKTMLKSCAEFCVTDMHPLEIIEGPGFEKLAQSLIDLGSKSGRLKIEDILPTQTTLSKKISQEADAAILEVFSTIMPYIEKEQGAISLNTWTDERKQFCYTNVTFHYVDDNWCLNSCLLFTEFLSKKRYSNDNMRKKITRKLLNLGVRPDQIQAIIFVSDQSAETLKHLQFYRHITCAETSFKKVIEKVFALEYLQEETPKLHHTLTGLDSFVKFLDQLGQSGYLSQPITYEEDNSWRGKLRLLTSIVKQSKEIFNLMEENSKKNVWFTNFNVVVAQELIEFLKLFEEAIDDLVDDRKPNLYLVLLWHKKILNCCMEREVNSVEIKKLKKRAEICLKSIFPIDYRHKLATFLWPPVRKMKMLSDLEKAELMRQVQAEINAIDCEEDAEMDPLADEEPQPKQRKTHFDHWMEIPNEGKY